MQVTGLQASTNNRASTVLNMFLDAVLAYGFPSRVQVIVVVKIEMLPFS
jgi:hypothetical protein